MFDTATKKSYRYYLNIDEFEIHLGYSNPELRVAAKTSGSTSAAYPMQGRFMEEPVDQPTAIWGAWAGKYTGKYKKLIGSINVSGDYGRQYSRIEFSPTVVTLDKEQLSSDRVRVISNLSMDNQDYMQSQFVKTAEGVDGSYSISPEDFGEVYEKIFYPDNNAVTNNKPINYKFVNLYRFRTMRPEINTNVINMGDKGMGSHSTASFVGGKPSKKEMNRIYEKCRIKMEYTINHKIICSITKRGHDFKDVNKIIEYQVPTAGSDDWTQTEIITAIANGTLHFGVFSWRSGGSAFGNIIIRDNKNDIV